MKHQTRFLLACWLIIASYGSLSAQERPNFIFILTDDQSYGMMGCTGNPIVQTPHLDQLAEDGVLFTNAHITSAICTPSRVSILLSQYERKHGVNFNSGTSVSEAAWANSYPVLMREAGYYTGWIGKNHAPIGRGGYQSGLMEKSFDYWYAGHGHLTFYPKSRHQIFDDAESDTQVEIMQEGVADFLDPNARKLAGALHFLDQRPSDQTFMLSICFNLPHSASTSRMELRESDDEIYKSLYRDQEIPLPANYVAKADITHPKLPADLLKVEDRQHSYDFVDTPDLLKERYIRQMQAMTGIDRMVGQLREQLEKLGLSDNTVLIFTSDHGLFMGEYGLGGKALCYEKVSHVPMMFFDPRRPRRDRGQQTDALAQTIDIPTTMLKMAGITVPESFQGKDLSPLLAGEDIVLREYVFTENLWSTHFGNPRCEAVQDKRWKYIRYYRNNNLSVLHKIATAKALGINLNQMLYGVHDPEIALYRSFIEAPFNGEEIVYEELYDLQYDPMEAHNLVKDTTKYAKLAELRVVCQASVKAARGQGPPLVLRYTRDSQNEALLNEQKRSAKP
ncbi:MAG: sulfatase-like hydrolase/transferase [Bacteroidota bacterium]